MAPRKEHHMNQKWFVYFTSILILGLIAIGLPAAFLVGSWYNRSPQIPEAVPSATPVIIFPTDVVLPVETATPLPTELPTNTPLPTETPLPTATTIPPTATAIPPTATPLPPTATATPAIPCYAAQFVADVTVPNGAPFPPDTGFTKTWRVRNVGTCSWTKDHDLVFISGTAMTKKNTVVALPGTVKPGETVEISVNLKSPLKAGNYTGTWALRDANGRFYYGNTQLGKLTVSIQVFDFSDRITYNLIVAACQATWKNSHKDPLLCYGSTTSSKGSITILNLPRLENRTENEPALWVRPDVDSDGRIVGTYPAYSVQNGDRFRAWVGCLADSKGCNVQFELKARLENGSTTSLGSWNEKYDGEVTAIDLDLSSLAGQKVQFVLSVTVIDGQPDKANAFWFMPRVENN
jgi:hypothetical protein